MQDQNQAIPDQFSLTIFDQAGILFQQNVVALSAVNDTGPFSILPGHSNFISIINGSLSDNLLQVHIAENQIQDFILELGVIRCFNNSVEIYRVIEIDEALDRIEQISSADSLE
ncbi:MAG: hypothetical protein WAU07_01605 [Microgenomates group bacterium]